MTTETITLNVAGNAVQQLQKVEQQVGKIGTAFAGLRNLVASIAFGSLINQTLQFADSIQDLSDATGLANSTILGFQQAVGLAGGKTENAQKGILKLIETIGDARNGSENAIKSFQNIGISLAELQILSEEDLLRKTIKGLSDISDVSKRSAAQVDLLGKNLRGIDVTKIQQQLSISIQESEKFEGSITKLSTAQEQLDINVQKLQLALVELLAPLSELAVKLLSNIELIKTIGKWILTIAAFFVSWTVIGRISKVVVSAISSMVKIFRNSIGILYSANGATSILGKTWQWLLSKIISFSATIYNLTQRIPGLNQIIYVITVSVQALAGVIAGGIAAWKLWGNSAEDAAEKAKKSQEAALAAISKSYDTHVKSRLVREEEQKQAQKQLQEQAAAAAKKQKEQTEIIVQANNQLRNSLLQIRQDYIKNAKAVDEAGNAEIGYAMMATDTADQIRAQREAYDTIIASIEDLQNQKTQLGAGQEHLNGLIDSEIQKLYAMIPAATEAARVRIQSFQEIRNAQDDLIKQTDLMRESMALAFDIDSITQQVALMGLYGDELKQAEIILEVTRTLQQSLMALRQRELDLINQKALLTEEQFKREMAHVEALKNAAYERASVELDARRKVLEQSTAMDKSYTEGIKSSLASIAESFAPINLAQDAVNMAWGKMSDAIDTFVETGKFNFGELARSILADLSKMILKSLVFKYIFGPAVGGLGSLLGGIGARAAGGPVHKDKPYLVGERGPELFVPPGNGNIVAIHALNNGMSTGTVSAPITNNYITNNINALDSKSVAQVFAQNRKSLLGSVKMAEKELPYATAGAA